MTETSYDTGNREEVTNMLPTLSTFLLSVCSSVIAHLLCKWLDEQDK